MRIKEQKETIDYADTQDFFAKRANKYDESAPYVVTMYSDNNPQLVKERNKKEMDRLLPLLALNENAEVLDLACGIGRWAEGIDKAEKKIRSYCGIDFCRDFISLAEKRCGALCFCHDKRFLVGKSTEVAEVLSNNGGGTFSRIIIVGALMYLNDKDMEDTLRQIEALCKDEARILIREPIGLESRLTLKEEFSGELNDNYSAIYRTRNELFDSLNEAFLRQGFCVLQEDFLFNEAKLNNRKETAQYFFVLERK